MRRKRNPDRGAGTEPAERDGRRQQERSRTSEATWNLEVQSNVPPTTADHSAISKHHHGATSRERAIPIATLKRHHQRPHQPRNAPAEIQFVGGREGENRHQIKLRSAPPPVSLFPELSRVINDPLARDGGIESRRGFFCDGDLPGDPKL
jgi:hypothetical protein